MSLDLPSDCPYRIFCLCSQPRFKFYLLREQDRYGEYPNIFIKVYVPSAEYAAGLIVVSDSGTGLCSKANPSMQLVDGRYCGHVGGEGQPDVPAKWNIATVLAFTVNQNHRTPYLIITSHCHYDHIMGIRHLMAAGANIRVVSSSHDKAYITPWKNLQKHSLCEGLGLQAPDYTIHWARDGSIVEWTLEERIAADTGKTDITIIHTPGHTPDSLSWYDNDINVLCVGDMFYERQSPVTKSLGEPAMPVIFNQDSNIKDWMKSMDKVLQLVLRENERLNAQYGLDITGNSECHQDGFGSMFAHEIWYVDCDIPLEAETWLMLSSPVQRVRLSAAHVTVEADAESAIVEMQDFMLRIMADKVPKKQIEDMWLWDDALASLSQWDSVEQTANPTCRFSVQAPWHIIHPASLRR